MLKAPYEEAETVTLISAVNRHCGKGDRFSTGFSHLGRSKALRLTWAWMWALPLVGAHWQPQSWNQTGDLVWWIQAFVEESRAPLPRGPETPWVCGQDFSLRGAQAKRLTLLPQTHASYPGDRHPSHKPAFLSHVRFTCPALENSRVCLSPFFYPLNPICHQGRLITDWNKSQISPNLHSFPFFERIIFTKYL